METGFRWWCTAVISGSHSIMYSGEFDRHKVLKGVVQPAAMDDDQDAIELPPSEKRWELHAASRGNGSAR